MQLAPELIDPDAEKVVRRLARRGHKAYLVGGCVRDLLIGRTPKDFDVATSATPNEIKQLFRNCRIIGRRFRLAHIFFGEKIIETSTFRANPRNEDEAEKGSELLIRRDNVFGTETDDAQRRDFTINGLFYDVATEEVIDHVGGLEDLQDQLIRTIGDPEIRFREDPVRMLRAVKFAARIDFAFENATWSALVRHREEIIKCAPPRVLEELYRMLRGGAARRSMELLIETGLAAVLSPQLAALFSNDVADVAEVAEEEGLSPEEAEWAATWSEDLATPGRAVLTAELPSLRDPDTISGRRGMAWQLLDELDNLALQKRGGSNALLLAALVNAFVFEDLVQSGAQTPQATDVVMDVLRPMVDQLRVARRDAERTRQIVLAQRRLVPSRRRRGRPMALVRRDYFSDALTLYEMTSKVLGKDTSDVARWRQLASEGGAAASGDDVGEESRSGKRRRRRRGGRRRRRTDDSRTTGEQGAAANG